jgi:N-acetylglucosaminyldiphosphoundecaprenol N-acetyl-beta-D-mannosaminyltransferase
MTCPDWIEQLATACAAADRSLFLLAGEPGVADNAVEKLREKTPGLRIDAHHGFFDKEGAENQQVIGRINTFKPDVLYVGMGMPLQERWIIDNIEQIDSRVILPLGACLDFYVGELYRGPRWMTDNGFEWMSRLITEPRRLARRYLIGNPLFLSRVVKQRFGRLKFD